MPSSESNASRQRWAQLMASKDAAGAAALYKDDARMLVPNSQPFEGRAAIEAGLTRMLEAGFSSVEMEALDSKEAGDLVIEYGRYTSEVAGQTEIGKYLVVLEREDDGSLKLAFDMYSSNGRPR